MTTVRKSNDLQTIFTSGKTKRKRKIKSSDFLMLFYFCVQLRLGHTILGPRPNFRTIDCRLAYFFKAKPKEKNAPLLFRALFICCKCRDAVFRRW